MSQSVYRQWPIPISDPRWLVYDPLRKDALYGILVGVVVGQILEQQNFFTFLMLFLACLVVQIARGVNQLKKTIAALKQKRFGQLKLSLIIMTGLAVFTLMIISIFFALAVGIVCLCLRIAALDRRKDVGLLIFAAAIWVSIPILEMLIVTIDSPVVSFASWGLIGLFVAISCNKNGYRLARLPMALLECTSLVFGVVLAGVSLTRTILATATSSPGLRDFQTSPRQGDVSITGIIDSSVHRPSHEHAQTIWVRGHLRTLPDGTVDNNFSGPQTNGVNPKQIYINEYQRSLPDGILENNLSYQSKIEPALDNSKPTTPWLMHDNLAQNLISNDVRGLKPHGVGEQVNVSSFISGIATLTMGIDAVLRDDADVRLKHNRYTIYIAHRLPRF